jgi:hypothetical protein
MKSKIANVITDLTKHIKNEQELDDIKTPRKYYYDRMEWVRINKSSRDDLYEIGLENLRVLVYQLGLFQRHILTDDEGNKINQIITE